MAHAHGFRGAGGARCEDEHEHVGGGDLDVREGRARVRRERGFPFGRVDHEQRVVGHDLARALEEIEVADSVISSAQSVWCTSRASSAPRRVGLMPTSVAPDERGGAEQHPELGHVVEQHAHVERRVGRLVREQERGPLGTGRDELGVRPRRILEAQPDPVVAGVRADEFGDGVHGGFLCSDMPIARTCLLLGHDRLEHGHRIALVLARYLYHHAPNLRVAAERGDVVVADRRARPRSRTSTRRPYP